MSGTTPLSLELDQRLQHFLYSQFVITVLTEHLVKIIEALSDRFAIRRCINGTTQAGVYTVQVEQLKATKELIKTAGIRSGFVIFNVYSISYLMRVSFLWEIKLHC